MCFCGINQPQKLPYVQNNTYALAYALKESKEVLNNVKYTFYKSS